MPALNLDELSSYELHAYYRAQTALARKGDKAARELASYAYQRRQERLAIQAGHEAKARAYRDNCERIKRRIRLADRWY